MKIAVILAASVPVAIFLLFTITAVIISCVVAVYKHKKAEMKFEAKVANLPVDVINKLSEKVPKSRYPEFLKFAEKILLGSNEVCHSSKEKEGEKGEDDVDGVTEEVVQSQEKSDVTAQVLKATTSILQSCLDNPKVGGQLSSTMVAMLAARGVPGVAVPPGGANIGAVNIMATSGDAVPLNSPHDLGYCTGSGSAHSGSEV